MSFEKELKRKDVRLNVNVEIAKMAKNCFIRKRSHQKKK
jgi:hypothetical protein